MVSASSLAHFNSTSSDNTLETVEIDPQYAEGLGFRKGDVVCAIILFLAFVAHTSQVEVGLLYDLPIAKSVATEPLTPDDWEILVRVFNITSKQPLTVSPRNYMQNT